MNVINKVLDLLTPRERKQAYLLVPVVLLMAMAEVAGIASVAPFLSLLADPAAAQNNRILAKFYELGGFETDRQFLLAVGVAVLLVILLSNGILAAGTWVMAHFGAMRNYSISRRLLISYLRQPYTFFLERNSAGLASNILQQVDQVIRGIAIPGLNAIAKGVSALAVLVMLIVLDPILALLAGVFLGGAYALIYRGTRTYLTRIGRERVGLNQERHKAANEAMGGIKQIKLAGREAEMVQRFSAPAYSFARYQASNQVIAAVPRYLLEGVAFASIVGIVLVLLSVGQAVTEMIPVLGVYAFAGYRLLPALQQVFTGLTQARYSLGSLDEVHEVVQKVDAVWQGRIHEGDFRSREHLEPLPFEKSLVLEDISYSYPGADRPILESINLEIRARSSVAFVGATGAGKTTLVDLILGLLSPTEGRILVDDKELDEDNLASWQNQIGYVPQSIFLADDTITRNIALGLPDERIDMEAVRRAASIAQLDEFIENELPAGYDTMVGERGVRLSGGQQQRLGIARALYGDPEVLVLDEATSALDNATEMDFFDAISVLSGRKTIIIIAHRLSTVRGCDEIFVLDRGRLDSRGTYGQLLDRSERFRRIAATSAEPSQASPRVGRL